MQHRGIPVTVFLWESCEDSVTKKHKSHKTSPTQDGEVFLCPAKKVLDEIGNMRHKGEARRQTPETQGSEPSKKSG